MMACHVDAHLQTGDSDRASCAWCRFGFIRIAVAASPSPVCYACKRKFALGEEASI